MNIHLSLSFFAALLHTDEKNLEFTIIMRKDTVVEKLPNGNHKKKKVVTLRRPGLRVKGVCNYVYDLVEGMFVRLGPLGSKTEISLEKTVYMVKTDRAVILRTGEGRTVEFDIDQFNQIYAFRVVNPALK